MAHSQALLNELETSGCHAYIRNCDITSFDDLSRVLSEAECNTAPIKGVIQAAMVLRDKSFHQMSFEDYTTAVRPKVSGTWNLHSALASHSLSFFIILSSFVGVAGNPGQANYAVGGVFEDAVARYRSSQGLPAVTIDLGAVKDIGYLVDHEDVADGLAKKGYIALGEKEVLDLVEAGIKDPIRDVNSAQVVTGISGSSWSCLPSQRDLRFEHLKPVTSSTTTSTSAESMAKKFDLRSRLTSETTRSQAFDIVLAALINKLATMFSIPQKEVHPTAPLSRYGVDSLIAAELRNWFSSAAKADVSIFDVTQSVSVSALAEVVTRKSQLLKD